MKGGQTSKDENKSDAVYVWSSLTREQSLFFFSVHKTE